MEYVVDARRRELDRDVFHSLGPVWWRRALGSNGIIPHLQRDSTVITS